MAKMKFHWGVGITIFYVSFVLVLVGFVIFTTFNKVELVDENYYESEIQYQQKIDKIKRSNGLAQSLMIQALDKSVLLVYPAGYKTDDISGTIEFYRPSEKNLDFKAKVTPDTSGKQIVFSNNFKKGLWKVKVDWAIGDSTYYNEQVLIMN